MQWTINNGSNENNSVRNYEIKFEFSSKNKDKDTFIKVHATKEFTVKALILGFRHKLCNDNIKIKYFLNQNIELDTESEVLIENMGINGNSIINAIEQD